MAANVPQAPRSGPVIDTSSLPIEAELERVVPLRVRATDDISGLRSIEVFINGTLVQAPQLLEGQQTAQVNFGYIPTTLTPVTIIVRSTAIDDRTSQVVHIFNVVEASPDGPEAVVGFDLPIAENDDPFDLALEFGVCPTRLVQANPGLGAIQPGDSILIPTEGSLSPTNYEECASIGQDTIEVINFFENPRLGIRRTFLASLYPIDPRYQVTPGRAFECSAFFTGVDGTSRGCPPEKSEFHTGIDIAAPNGTDLYSVSDGVVTWAGTFKDWMGANFTPDICHTIAGSEPPHEGYGNMVLIETTINGVKYEFLYAHLSVINVSIGDRIDGSGFVIGLIGSTGCSTAPHLHFEVRERGRVIDPIAFLEDQTENTG